VPMFVYSKKRRGRELPPVPSKEKLLRLRATMLNAGGRKKKKAGASSVGEGKKGGRGGPSGKEGSVTSRCLPGREGEEKVSGSIGKKGKKETNNRPSGTWRTFGRKE